MAMFGTGINRTIDVINQDDDSCKSLIHKVYNTPQSLADALRQNEWHPHLRFKTRAAAAEVRLPKNNIIFKKSPNQSPNIYTKPILEKQPYLHGEQPSLISHKSIGYKMTNNPNIKGGDLPLIQKGEVVPRSTNIQKVGDHHSLSKRTEVVAHPSTLNQKGTLPTRSNQHSTATDTIQRSKDTLTSLNQLSAATDTKLNTFYNIHPSEHKRMLDS